MVRMPWATFLWPGLPQLWYGGQWSGLVLAIGFAALVNVLLLATFVWVELIRGEYLRVAWLATGSAWIGSAALSACFGRKRSTRRAFSADGMFREAINEYLRENWFEAERILGRLAHLGPRDAEARLMLATLMRHTDRHDEALEHLARLELLADAEKWAAEIAAERRWITLARAGRQQPDPFSAIDTPCSTAPPRAA